LTESVLFGHRRGAFSGATSDSDGLLRAANGGTLLLDEIGDMPLALQPALLRVIETGEVLPVGATQPARTDARFIAATNVDLEARVASGAFREDLYARLAGFVFRMPPLRERREDIGLLAGALLRRIGQERGGSAPRLSPDAATSLLLHAWPRNVRELEKCLARAAVLAGDGARIETGHLPREVRERTEQAGPSARASRSEGEDARARLVALLTEHRGNLAAVAAAMGTLILPRFGGLVDYAA
jgi:transcriptional regulator with GAF, ATPase, and Fis domain